MFPFFFLNVLIVGVIMIGIAWTSNPLFIMGLMLLRDMPVFPPQYMVDGQSDNSDRDNPAQPMGFTAQIT